MIPIATLALRAFGGGLALLLSATLLAHGGQYRGPSGVVPQSGSSGGSGGSATGPSGVLPAGPSSGSPSGSAPTTPPPTVGSAAANVGTTPRGVVLGPDLTRWQYYWEFNKDAYVGLKDALTGHEVRHGSDDALLGARRDIATVDRWRPTEKEITGKIVPVLKSVLAEERQRDIVSGAMVALAKVCRDPADPLSLFRSRLASHDQEIRETAALAMGITQAPAALDDLTALFQDSALGHALTDRASVDNRTRAFAGYGLGLIAFSNDDPAMKRAVFEVLAPVLAVDAQVDRNVRVAAINATRILALRPDLRARDKLLRDRAVEALWRYYQAELGPGEHWMQAHVPGAVSRLLGRGDSAMHQRVKDGLLAELAAQRPRSNPLVESAALALGQLALPAEKSPREAGYSDGIAEYLKRGKDRQARHYCILALSHIGGPRNQARLIEIANRGRQLERSWAALALGSALRDAGNTDPAVGAVLHRGLLDIKDPEVRAAFAVAVGLAGHQPAIPDLHRLLDQFQHQDEFAGYLCIGLALLGDRQALPQLRAVVRQSVRRPDLLKQAAIALGRLGDWNVTDILRDALTDPDQSVARIGAVASALGQIGDRRTIEPLLELLEDKEQQPLTRAFAAVALGGMGDKEELPWSSKIARGLNYRAAVETLTDVQGSGILDIF